MVTDHSNALKDFIESGYNCSQSVLAAFSEEFGLPRETALKIAAPFGGGFGGYGKTCGALTGAMMVIGLKYGNSDGQDLEAKLLARAKTRELIEAFEKAHGTSTCNELLGIDRSNLSGAELKAKLPCIHDTCKNFLITVIAFLEEDL